MIHHFSTIAYLAWELQSQGQDSQKTGTRLVKNVYSDPLQHFPNVLKKEPFLLSTTYFIHVYEKHPLNHHDKCLAVAWKYPFNANLILIRRYNL